VKILLDVSLLRWEVQKCLKIYFLDMNFFSGETLYPTRLYGPLHLCDPEVLRCSRTTWKTLVYCTVPLVVRVTQAKKHWFKPFVNFFAGREKHYWLVSTVTLHVVPIQHFRTRRPIYNFSMPVAGQRGRDESFETLFYMWFTESVFGRDYFLL